MDEFEFDDDNETEDKSMVSSSIASSPSGNSTVSVSNTCTSNRTAGGNKRKRRHRLNRGSSRLLCRKGYYEFAPERVVALDRNIYNSHSLCDSSTSGESCAVQQPLSQETEEDNNRNLRLEESKSLPEFSRRRRRKVTPKRDNQNKSNIMIDSLTSLSSPSSFLSDHSSLGVLAGKGNIMVNDRSTMPSSKRNVSGKFHTMEMKIDSGSNDTKDANLRFQSGDKVIVARRVDNTSSIDDSRLDNSQSKVNMSGKITRENVIVRKDANRSPSIDDSRLDDLKFKLKMPGKMTRENVSIGKDASILPSINDVLLLPGKIGKENVSRGKDASNSPSIKGSRSDDLQFNINMTGKISGKNKSVRGENERIPSSTTSSIDDSRLYDSQCGIEHAESNDKRTSDISHAGKGNSATSREICIIKDTSKALHKDEISRKDDESTSIVSMRKSESQNTIGTTNGVTLTKKSSHRRPKQKTLRDDDVFEANYYGDDLNNGFIEYSQSSQNSSIVSFSPNPSEKVITGARSDAFAVQDVGSYRLLSDECNYFCSSFLSSIGTEERCDMSKIHNTISADAACDLALMLSSKKTRQIMANLGNSQPDMNIGSQGSEPSIENCPYDSILTVLSFPPESIDGSSMDRVDLDSITESKTRSKEQIIRRNGTLQRKTKNARTLEIHKSSRYSSPTKNCYDTVVSNALASIAYHISLDCTTNKDHSAMRSPAEVGHFRMKILKEKRAILGITKLLLDDQIVSSILAKNVSSEIRDENIAAFPLTKNQCDSHKNIGKKVFADPTRLGRKKKRRRKPLVESEEEIQDASATQSVASVENCEYANLKSANFDFHSVGTPQSIASSVLSIESFSVIGESIPKRFKKKLVSIWSKMNIHSLSHSQNDVEVSAKTCHYCCNGNLHTKISNPGHLALTALNRILTGKYDEDDEGEISHSDITAMDTEANNSCQHIAIDEECCDTDEIEKSNFDDPMVQKNVLFRQSGAIPFLVQAMIETLESAVLLTSNVSNETKTSEGDADAHYCSLCLRHLYGRVHCISTTIDGLCCMSQPNRNMICGMTSTSIISSLLKSLSNLLATSGLRGNYHDLVKDISVATLRTLTCLTHENDLAATQMISDYERESLISRDSESGIEIILRLLHTFEIRSQRINEKSESQQYHDAIIFCLNILTNTLESSSVHIVRKKILKLKLHESRNGENQLAPVWLACWVVRQTESFRDVLLSGCFGHNDETTVGNEKERELKLHEDEYLVRAGNGCILLACLLREQKESTEEAKGETQQLRDLVLSQMPISKHGNRMILMINTMKAFCNFYRYSIGEFMSVAVTAPVVKLIEEVEEIDIIL
eukprot:CAMPEP_0194117770 /NCGR_PEP_ID=MMETSP0150-20130528/32688_1 /TAXON_ID=122233 /ORGANISM="Chaetoceros debilis, Strain MM31A-1" /LENGTH=1337 /DNA_ID=CAMNT_0038808913 /DNA_START=207 /DNA_END=4220 /DNA_ORIENTATION=-